MQTLFFPHAPYKILTRVMNLIQILVFVKHIKKLTLIW